MLTSQLEARFYGVMVSTLDSESSDRGSNPREAFSQNNGSSEILRDEVVKHLFFLACRRVGNVDLEKDNGPEGLEPSQVKTPIL